MWSDPKSAMEMNGKNLRGWEIVLDRRGLPRSPEPQTLLPIHSRPTSHLQVSTSSPSLQLTLNSHPKSITCIATLPFPTPLMACQCHAHTSPTPTLLPPMASPNLAQSLPARSSSPHCPNHSVSDSIHHPFHRIIPRQPASLLRRRHLLAPLSPTLLLSPHLTLTLMLTLLLLRLPLQPSELPLNTV
jgi:hypothetical protein